jgi:glycosyltransferase involved in cell wall biosynthesis
MSVDALHPDARAAAGRCAAAGAGDRAPRLSRALVPATVDVILPTHARPHTIGYAIAAVLRQSHRDLVLHVVGDGCDDATVALVEGIADPRLRLHRFPKAFGFGYANRNRVLAATTAPFVAYASDDDLWLPDHLERALAALEDGPLDLVASREAHVMPPGVLEPHFFAFDWQRGPLAEVVRRWFIGAVGLVHRRTVFDRLGYWDETLPRFGDREFHHRVRRSPLPTAYRDEVSLLRFYAQYWDPHYPRLPAAPQERYLALSADPAWCAAVRAAAAPGARSVSVRLRQLTDFTRFGVRRGAKFLRIWYGTSA